MNHKWDKTTSKPQRCIKCGLYRDRFKHKLLMAIVNHPPWEVYKYENKYHYWFNNHVSPTTIRPKCK